MSEPDPPEGAAGEPVIPERPTRLDPDRAIAAARGEARPGAQETDQTAPRVPRPPPPVIDTRRYQWMIGGFGLVLVFIFSVYLYAHNGTTQPGVAPGHRLHDFVAPLATSDLDLPANAHPRCNPARPARRGLNVCGHKPIVITFFALGATRCEREVDTMQTIAGRFRSVQFAAVAISADLSGTAKLVRSHHWTIPVAFDSTGLIGELYGITICPIIEMAGVGGVVQQRLIGYGWEHPAQLIPRVEKFIAEIAAR